MKHITLVQRISTLGLAVVLAFGQVVLPVVARADDAVLAPRGPQGVVGPQGPTGPQTPTGPKGQTGVQPITQPTDPALVPSSGTQPAVAADTLAPSGDTAMSNETTGSNSANSNAQQTTNTADITNTNDASVGNDINLNATSGANTISQNTLGGNIATGDLQGSINLLNVTNSVFAPGSSVGVQSLAGGANDLYLLASDGRTLLPTNDTTGANSANTNTIDGTNVVHFITANTSDVDNDVTIVADTGNNVVTENSSLGDFMTGSIDMALNLINLINLQLPNLLVNLDIWSIFGDVTGNLILPTNSTTGSNSLNQNAVNQTNTAAVDLTQTADVANGFNVKTNTGGNTIDQNTVVGNVTTGDVDVKGGVTTVANAGQPVLYLINVLGKWIGQAFLPGVGVIVNELGNSDTGANSENTNTVDQTNELTASVDQTATVNNSINLDLNTGNNTVARNSKVGDISTGAINVMANVVNFVNSFGGDLSQFSLGIVNVFGNWFGNAATAGSTASALGETGAAATADQAPGQTAASAQSDAGQTETQAVAAYASDASASGQAVSTTVAATTAPAATTAAVDTQQIASAQVLGASNTLADVLPQVAGSSDRKASGSALPWLVAGAVLLAGWVFVEVMAARTLKRQAGR